MNIRTKTLLAVPLACVIPAQGELTATFLSGGKTDTRTDRLPALYIPAGQPPTPFLEAGPFEVTWTGVLDLNDRLRLHFSFGGSGTASLSIDGELVHEESGSLGETRSERLRLNPGEHEIVIRYRAPEQGPAHFRLFWEERSFPRQSVPPTAFKPTADASPAEPDARIGRKLFAEAHCAKCHQPQSGFGPAPMPELLEIAPILGNSGNRLNPEWIADWIARPHELKPGTTMPALVDPETDEGRRQAADLAAWLATLKIYEVPEPPDPDLAQIGGAHFHQLGCVSCHSRPDADPDPARVPLDRVAAKYQPGALVAFLEDPAQWAPHTKMPDFKLDRPQASALAAWLLRESADGPKPGPFPDGDAGRGLTLATELNCGACHAGSPLDLGGVPSLEAIFEADWGDSGCLTDADHLPKYHFDSDQVTALRALAAAGPESLGRHVPAEHAGRQLEELRCTACHGFDAAASRLSETHYESSDLVAHLDPDQEKLDQTRPHLTLVGEMLHASYIERMIAGEERARPWLDMNMPAYVSRAKPLAEGLARLHGVEPGGSSAGEPNTELAAIGKQLVGTDGFACTTCHAVGDTPPSAAFEVGGVNFALSHRRLRKEWYMRWMDNPLSVTPQTKMPRYSKRGRSQRTDILDGDAAAQFDAIWQYLMTLDPASVPESGE